MNILEVNKSCFKDCFYSFSHTWLHTPFLSDLPVTLPPPFPFQIPPLVSVEHCLSFRLSFVISSLNTFFFFVSIFGFSCLPTPPSLSLQFSSLFSLVFGFYQSVAHGPFRRRNPNPGGNLPVFASVGTTVLPPREKGHKHHHQLNDQNPFSRAVRMYMCACVCVFGKRWDNRGGTVEVF